MALSKETKQNQITEIKDLISSSNSIIVWDYLGLTSEQITEIRSKLKKAGSKNTVYKNRVAKIAFKEAKQEEILEHLTGPSSFLFTTDDNPESMKIIREAIKSTDGKIEFKCGYIDGTFYDANGVLEIASLPTKDELLSMLLSVLQAGIRNLAYSVSQIAEQKEQDTTKK